MDKKKIRNRLFAVGIALLIYLVIIEFVLKPNL